MSYVLKRLRYRTTWLYWERQKKSALNPDLHATPLTIGYRDCMPYLGGNGVKTASNFVGRVTTPECCVTMGARLQTVFPSSNKLAVRCFGMDQTLVLARLIARNHNWPFRNVLLRPGCMIYSLH